MSKVMKRAVAKQLLQYLLENDLLYNATSLLSVVTSQQNG